jgi:hypothetical protein
MTTPYRFKVCGAHTGTKAEIIENIEKNKRLVRESRIENSGQTLYVDVRYICLFVTDDQKVSLSRVQENHRVLNACFGGQNADDLAKVPNTTLNPWAARIGNPRIQFLPIDASQVTCEYKRISTPLDSNEPVVDAAIRGGRVSGVLNVYISTAAGGNILGQAELQSSIVYVLHTTVGGPQVAGTLSNFNRGKTLVHEVGHSFGLSHTFSDQTCDSVKPYPDIPETTLPSYDTQVFLNSDSKWDQKNDERDKDRRGVGSNRSCLNIDSSTNLMAVNVMDYGADAASLMFSASQATIMRDYLLSSSNTTLAMKSINSPSFSQTGAASGPAIGSSSGSGSGAGSGSSTSSSTVDTTTVIIAVSSVVGGLILMVVAYTAIKRHRSNRSSSSSSNRQRKNSDSQ